MTKEQWKASIVAAFREGREPNAWPITKGEFAELIVSGVMEKAQQTTAGELVAPTGPPSPFSESADIMKTVFLYTESNFVAAVEVPPFTTGFPDVLIWGNRVFCRQGDAGNDTYCEVFAYTVLREVHVP